MRPVDKGASPRVFTDYREARDPLMAQIGKYCSYCERILSDPEVEHQEPKANLKYAHRALDWDNFLLACTTCNRQKGIKDPRQDTIYFPDEANTACAFRHDEASNQVYPRFDVKTHPDEHAMAERTIALTNLNRRLDEFKADDKTGVRREDLRWMHRKDAWEVANRALQRHLTDGALSQKDIESIRELALKTGFFSVWLTVFANEPDVCNDLIAAFVGTRLTCFDPQTGHPIANITLLPA
jgi:uncharacterized protein (TIGR02646 family)